MDNAVLVRGFERGADLLGDRERLWHGEAGHGPAKAGHYVLRRTPGPTEVGRHEDQPLRQRRSFDQIGATGL